MIEYIFENKILFIIIGILLLIIIYNFLNPTVKVVSKPIIQENNIEEIEENIKVEIKGAVVNPGVYETKKDSRLIDLIMLAGGLNEDANTDYINLSQILEDQMVVKIFTNEDLANSKKVEIVYEYIPLECECINNLDSTCDTSNKININTSTKEELMTLEGIGESKAINIIEYRTKNGNFKNIEDIVNVSGIGQSAFEKIKENITV